MTTTMFSPNAQTVIDRAKDIGFSRGDKELTLNAIASALTVDSAAIARLAEALSIDESLLQRHFLAPASIKRCQDKMPLAGSVREMLALAKSMVKIAPSRRDAGLVGVPHLVCAIACKLSDEDFPPGARRPDEAFTSALLLKWAEEQEKPPSLGGLTRRLRMLRQDLTTQVHGQDHAVHQFVEGLFNVEVVASADASRRKPAGLFVFAGPPGVGKTYLAELASTHLDRPFKRFDMSAFSHSHEVSGLIGTPKMYQGAQAGSLTDFVQQNPNALLLFDEIEKAHSSAIHLFLQILDAGRLQDKFTEQDVAFRDTIIIFTSNVGRKLYENENSSGVHAANAAFHRTTILDALRTEVDPRTREPFFPAAICSRMATGYPILFNRLRVVDLCRIVQTEIERVSNLIQNVHGQRISIQREIPLALVMREGVQTDARTMKSQGEVFLKEEVFKACQLFTDTNIDTAFGKIEEISIEIDPDCAGETAEKLFSDLSRPEVLFVGSEMLGNFYCQMIPEIEWILAANQDQAFDVLAKRSVDFVLLDLAVQTQRVPGNSLCDSMLDVSGHSAPRNTELWFDHAPLAARKFAAGQQMLEQMHSRMPDVPVYLFSLEENEIGLPGAAIDEELLVACVRAGGARGAIRTSLGGLNMEDIEAERTPFAERIASVAQQLRREKIAADLATGNQVVTFATAPALSADGSRLLVRCRNFRMARAVRSTDADSVISDAERPATRFDDVIGARSAKEALLFIRDWLQNPKSFAAAGIDPPRGVLLSGPPGTGKTMLARALAGESNCTFISETATSFVTKYTGSGPEAVRELFARARRYAPSIVFIDEIDAIGQNRASVSPGHVGHAESLTLNQLLVEMDGFAKATMRPIIVLAATNHPEKLDPALLRRFSRTIEVELPTRSEREEYLNLRLAAKARHEVSAQMVQRLAAQGQGMSVADLERILAHAAVMAIASGGVITDTILAEAFEKVTMGEAKAGGDPLRTARHEAGHAVIMCATGSPPIYVTIVGRGNFGGYAAFEDTEERRSRTRPELESQICQLMGGREAECLYYGEDDGVSTGPSSDLERATNLAEAMVYDLGMSKEIGFIKIDRKQRLPDELARKCHGAVQSILTAMGERTRRLLAEYRPALDRIGDALMERDRLLKHEVLELMESESQVQMKGAVNGGS
jgi:ATP-dependent metalloprotease FtsH